MADSHSGTISKTTDETDSCCSYQKAALSISLLAGTGSIHNIWYSSSAQHLITDLRMRVRISLLQLFTLRVAISRCPAGSYGMIKTSKITPKITL